MKQSPCFSSADTERERETAGEKRERGEVRASECAGTRAACKTERLSRDDVKQAKARQAAQQAASDGAKVATEAQRAARDARQAAKEAAEKATRTQSQDIDEMLADLKKKLGM
jgi:hypothetical protein